MAKRIEDLTVLQLYLFDCLKELLLRETLKAFKKAE